MSLATKNIHHASVLISDENQPWRHKFSFAKRQFLSGVCSQPHSISMQFNFFSSFLSLLVDNETDTDVSFPTPINDAECKARLCIPSVTYLGLQTAKYEQNRFFDHGHDFFDF